MGQNRASQAVRGAPENLILSPTGLGRNIAIRNAGTTNE
jgi:hypothetical protein